MSNFEEIIIQDSSGTTAHVSDPDGDGEGGLDVYVQDQYTDSVDLHLMGSTASFTLASTVIVDQRVFTAVGGHSISAGDIVLFQEGHHFSQFVVTSVVTNTITVDSPFDEAYTSSATCTNGTNDMSVDGSVTPVHFSVGPLSGQSWDIVRMVITIQDGSSMDASMLGSIVGGVTNGIVFRRKNGHSLHLFNAKTNGDFASRTYDVSYDDRAGGGGKYFMRSRRTWGGQGKSGITIRLIGTDSEIFEAIVQDNLTALDNMRVVIQGHLVE